MNEKIQSSELAWSLVSGNATSAHQPDSSNTGQTEIVETTMPQELNTLANRAMDGDVDAFNQLYSRCFDIARGYSYRLPGYVREEFIRDVCQRFTTCIIEKRWEDTGVPFEAWIHKTAFNAVSESRRTLERRSAEIQDPEFVFEDVEDVDISTEGQILQEEEKNVLWSLVMKLPEIPAIVIYERYARNKPFSEIGEKIGKTEVNCRKIHQRALESLRQLIHASGYYPEYEHGSTKKGSGSLEDDDSGRAQNEKKAHKPSQ